MACVFLYRVSVFCVPEYYTKYVGVLEPKSADILLFSLCRSERDAEKRLRVQAENDARRAKAAADQAAAAAAEASRSLKLGEKQIGGKGKDGEVREASTGEGR